MSDASPRSHRTRWILSIAIGLANAYLLSRSDGGPPGYAAADLTPLLHAARMVLAGESPYTGATMLYPMPALLSLIPLTPFSDLHAYAIWGGLASGLITWAAFGRHGPHGIAVTLSRCANRAIVLAQWAPWQYLGALYPGWQVLAAAKPTIGLIVWLYRPTRWAFIGGIILVLLSFVVLPTWLNGWLGHTGRADWYVPALLVWQGGGPLLAFAVLRWRRPEARLLLALAIVPHNFIWYDQLLLFLVPTRPRELWSLCVLSWVSAVVANYFFQRAGIPEPAGQIAFRAPIVALLYLPSLAMTLRRPNEGPAVPWLEGRIAGLPSWIRGSPAPAAA